MTPLEFVQPGQAAETWNVLAYGGPKAGKTTGATSAPGPVLVLNADQPAATRYPHSLGRDLREVHVTGRQVLEEAYLYLAGGDSGVRTVVVDPIGEVHRVLIEERSGRAIRPKIQEYGDVAVELERFCRGLCELPVNVVMVCHETAVKDEESGHFERLPWTGTSNPALGAKLMAMVDIVTYCAVIEKDDEPTKYVGQLVTANGRRGGDRSGALGPWREMDLTEWFAVATKAMTPPAPKPKSTNNRKQKEKVTA